MSCIYLGIVIFALQYLCGALPSGVFLMQWYDPLNKFMLLKHFECSIANPPRYRSLLIKATASPDLFV
jgi:hypothetical protein